MAYGVAAYAGKKQGSALATRLAATAAVDGGWARVFCGGCGLDRMLGGPCRYGEPCGRQNADGVFDQE